MRWSETTVVKADEVDGTELLLWLPLSPIRRGFFCGRINPSKRPRPAGVYLTANAVSPR
jgi:hypothetical protein